MERNDAADVPKYGTADHLTKIPIGKSHFLRDRLCLVATLPLQQNAGHPSENEVDGQVNERKPGWVRYGRQVHDPATREENSDDEGRYQRAASGNEHRHKCAGHATEPVASGCQ